MSEQLETSGGVLEITMFGGAELRFEGRQLSDRDSRSLKLWNVMCYLILNRKDPVTQASLIETFWPDEEQSNPASALKMLIMRLRNMVSPLLGGMDPIISRRGTYQWNPEIPCRVDAEYFQELCAKAERTANPTQRGELLHEAVALYRDDLLPRYDGQWWLLTLRESCHSLYVKTVLSYASLLEDTEQYAQMEALCRRATEIIRLEERLHTLVVRSMMLQGKNAEALRYYKDITKVLYNELGVRPSEKLQELHDKAAAAENVQSDDLGVILSQMDERETRGAFYCEYSFFKSLYQLEARRASRSGLCLHVALLTLTTPAGTAPDQNVIEPLMSGLLDDILGSLRFGDVASRSGQNQYIIMLPGANLEDSKMVMDRIISAARRRLRVSAIELSCQLRGLGEI